MNIKFLNEPKLSGHEVDKDLDEARIFLVPKIGEFTTKNRFFEGETVSIKFFHTGVSSLVCLLESPLNKYILKMKLRPSAVNAEASFLKKWEDIGVRVPHIYECGKIGEYNYILMEHIDADILSAVYNSEELILKNKFFEMGQVLRRMHSLVTDGFGPWGEEEKAKYKTFEDWTINDKHIPNQITYTKENNLLPKEIFGSIDEIIKKLIRYTENDKRSTYCHFDFSPGNILNTEPITIFDPVCLVNHPYLDLAKSIVQSIGVCGEGKIAEQLISGYFDKEIYDKEVVKNFVLFVAVIKFPYWHKKGNTKSIEAVISYLKIL